MSLCCGIVGLPNVGKSTLFNALSETAAAAAANYPFCTIEPNVGRVPVPDSRLINLAAIASSKNIIYNQLEFIDIAGLIKGASQGAGLGNQFLSHIRQTNCIIHMVRCFDDSDIIHTEETVDPLRDIAIIQSELLFSDIASIDRRLQKKVKNIDTKLLTEAYEFLLSYKPGMNVPDDFFELDLIVSKPVIYVCNVKEHDMCNGNKYTNDVQKTFKDAIVICAAFEAEMIGLSLEEKKDLLMGQYCGLEKVIRAAYSALDLITFFTIGPKEARAWTINKGSNAPRAAGVIHSDFERGFITAETISYEDYVKFKGEQQAKMSGCLRQEGKNYIVNDGDVIHFRFNV